MTAIISVIAGPFAYQVSDRLVTFASGTSASTFDPVAVKAISVHLVHSAFSIAYCGIAMLDGRPTDTRIAEALIGHEIESYSALSPVSPTTARTSALHALNSIAGELGDRVRKEPLAVRQQGLEVVLCGFERIRKGQWRPILRTASWSESRKEMVVKLRNEIPPFDRTHPGVLNFWPSAGARTPETSQRLTIALRAAHSPDAVLDALVKEVRSIAEANPTVGADVQVSIVGPREAFPSAKANSSAYLIGSTCEVDPLSDVANGFTFHPWRINQLTWTAPTIERSGGMDGSMRRLENVQKFVPGVGDPRHARGLELIDQASTFISVLRRPKLPRR